MQLLTLILWIFVSTTTLVFSLSNEIDSKEEVHFIKSIESLSEIPTYHEEQTLFLFDLDDTVFDFPCMVGSKEWRKYIVKETQKNATNYNFHDIFSYFLTKKHPVVTVESITSQFIRKLQENGHIVCGLTARERNKWYDSDEDGVDKLTLSQLTSVNVFFDHEKLKNTYPSLSLESEYYKGTFFADIEPKGGYVLKIFKNAATVPKKVIFIDDKFPQVESVAKALSELGIQNECYHYKAIEKKAKLFSPLIANIQLYYFCKSNGQKILSDEEAKLIAEKEPNNAANHYFQAALELIVINK